MSDTPQASQQSSSTEPMITQRDMLGAMEVLAGAGTEPEVLITLTDEELRGLDGASALALLGSPYLDQDQVDADSASASALRSLTARGLVRPGGESVEEEGELVSGSGDPSARPVQLDRRLAGVVTLRRIPEGMITTTRALNGGSTTLAHYLFPRRGVLEEYVTVDGFHHFSVPEVDEVAERIRKFTDPFGVAGEDGEPTTTTRAEAVTGPEAEDTRALSVITSVAEGEGRQATVVATSDRVRVIDDGAVGPKRSPQDQVQVSDVSPESLRSAIDLLVPRSPEEEPSGDEGTGGPGA